VKEQIVSKKSFLIIFLLCVGFGCLLIIVGGVSMATQRLLGIIMLANGLGLLLLAYPAQNAFLKKQQESVIDSLKSISRMDSDRFCEITEALRNSDTVLDCTLGDELTWQDVLFAIDHHAAKIFQETGISSKEQSLWIATAITVYADKCPFPQKSE